MDENRLGGIIDTLRRINETRNPSDIIDYLKDDYHASIRKTAKAKIHSLLRSLPRQVEERYLFGLMDILEKSQGNGSSWYRRNLIEIVGALSYNACLRFRLLKYISQNENSLYILMNEGLMKRIKEIEGDKNMARAVMLCHIMSSCHITTIGIESEKKPCPYK